MKKAAVILLMLVTVYVYGQKPAVVTSNDPGWQRIGQITASFKMTSESIVVLGADEFEAIKLRVDDAPINIERLQVFYESGDMEEIDVRSVLRAGSETRTINLKHPTRDIQKVAFTYKTLPNETGTKADVELYGRKAVVQKSDSYRDDNDRDDDVEKAAERTEEDLEDAAERTENDIEKAAEETEKDVENAAEEIEEETEEAAEKVEKETSTVEDGFNESVAIVEAEVKDKVFAGKRGPNNEIVYIDRNSKYYYIDKKGKKISILKSQMKDVPKDNK